MKVGAYLGYRRTQFNVNQQESFETYPFFVIKRGFAAVSATIPETPENTLARNLWQLEEERIGRDRRIALRDRQVLIRARPGWWRRPLVWAAVFFGVFIARDAFAALLVEFIIIAGN